MEERRFVESSQAERCRQRPPNNSRDFFRNHKRSSLRQHSKKVTHSINVFTTITNHCWPLVL